MAKTKSEINLKEDPRKDLTGVGTPEVGAPTEAEMQAAGEQGAKGKGVEREEPAAPGTESSRRVLPQGGEQAEGKDELDPEGMAGYRQGDAVLGSEGNTK